MSRNDHRVETQIFPDSWYQTGPNCDVLKVSRDIISIVPKVLLVILNVEVVCFPLIQFVSNTLEVGLNE